MYVSNITILSAYAYDKTERSAGYSSSAITIVTITDFYVA